MNMFNPPHPGELIKETIETLNVSIRALAKALNVAPSTLQRVISGKSSITPEMAIKLSYVIGSAPHVWLGMQDDYDLWTLKNQIDLSKLHRLRLTHS